MESLKEIIIPIVKEASKIFLNAHGISDAKKMHEKSTDTDFVTVYNVKIQNFLISEIKKQIPNAEFIAEEQENNSSSLQS